MSNIAMNNEERIYEVSDSNRGGRFLTPEAMRVEYPTLYEVIREWGSTYINAANHEGNDVMVNAHRRSRIDESQITTKEDLS